MSTSRRLYPQSLTASVFQLRTTEGHLLPVLLVDDLDGTYRLVPEVVTFMQALVSQGESLTAMVPDDHINDLRAGIEQLEDYPAIATFLGDLRHQVLTLGAIDESKLMTGPLAVPVEL